VIFIDFMLDVSHLLPHNLKVNPSVEGLEVSIGSWLWGLKSFQITKSHGGIVTW